MKVIGQIVRLVFIINIVLVERSSGLDYTIRDTKYGKVKGLVETVHGTKRVEKFLGVPYASPPVGRLRLEEPQPPVAWGPRILNALELPPACLQFTEGVSYIDYHVPGFNRTSEDCLFLNIYLPRGNNHRSMPVLVFIHGGSYRNGMGAMLDGSFLATNGIVVVSFNYRLGPLGFMTASDESIRGNYGMLDMIQTLKWVKENIEHFHGDPSSVTIDGHSAGGCSVGLLLLSPLAKGLFHRVIQQSGSPLAHWAVSRFPTRPDFYYKLFSTSLDCYRNSSAEVKICLQALPSKSLEKVINEDFELSASLSPEFRPVVDHHFLPATPEELVQGGQLNAKSFMTGSTKDEGLVAAILVIKMYGTETNGYRKLLSVMDCFGGDLPDIPGVIDMVLDLYVRLGKDDITDEEIEQSFSEVVGDYFVIAPTHSLADKLSRRNVDVYVYSYEYKSTLDQWTGVVHGAELFYLSGSPFTGHKNFRYDQTDKAMSRTLLHLWANFVKYGVPSLRPRDEMYMPRYTTKDRLYSRIHADDRPIVSVSSNLKSRKMTFWNEEIQAQYNQVCSRSASSNCSNGHYESLKGITNTWTLIAVCILLSVVALILAVAYYRTRREMARLLRQNVTPPNGKVL